MKNRSVFALVVALVSVLLAIIGNLLLKGTAWGLNLPLWILLSTACGLGLLRKSDVTFSRTAKWLFLPVATFSLCFFWRDSDALKAANGFALALAIGVLAQRAQLGRPASASIREYTLNILAAWFGFIVDFSELVFKEIDWHNDAPSKKQAIVLFRGLALAFPLLLLFGGLFVSADAGFSSAVQKLFSFDATELVTSFGVAAILTVLVGGLFRRLFWSTKPPVVRATTVLPEKPQTIGPAEVAVMLVCLDALFVAFVTFQFRFLFGGANHVTHVAGLTYAEYARGGFFELTAASLLSIPMLVGAQALLPNATSGLKRSLLALGGVLSGCVFVVIASALVRMNAYIQAYGLTELRFFTTLFVGWIAVTLAWLSVSFILKKRSFAFGTLVSGYAFILLANCLNPDALIARANLEAAKTPDLSYVSGLSLDAAPEIVNDSRLLSPEDRTKLLSDSRKTWDAEFTGADWRSLNISRIRSTRR